MPRVVVGQKAEGELACLNPRLHTRGTARGTQRWMVREIRELKRTKHQKFLPMIDVTADKFVLACYQDQK